MIAVDGLTKRYGSTAAVSDLSFRLRRGAVTGFLGPNGAGKTTTMRLILGLDYASAGIVTIDGRPHQQSPAPMHEVGALLEARAVRGGRSARNHLLCLAQTNRIPASRVNEVLGIVGLADVGRKRSKSFSLGMSQRLGIAAALLGDPEILMFDEPVNGLDPEGILWIRTLMKSLAAEGRTVFVSSHLMSEMENTANHLIVIGRGRSSRIAAWLSSSPAVPATPSGSGRRSRICWPEPSRTPGRGSPAPRLPAPPPPLRSRPGWQPRPPGRTRRERAHRGTDRRHRVRQRHPPAPPLGVPGLAGARLHGTDRQQRGLPRGAARRPPAGPERNGDLT